LESIISKYQESRKTNKYIDVLEDIVYNYNHSHHRGINDNPESRYQANTNIGIIKMNKLNNQIKIGNKVRILIEKGTFTKGYEPSYSKTIYTVVNGNGYSYSLVDNNGQALKKTWKYYQLKKILQINKLKENDQCQTGSDVIKKNWKNWKEFQNLKTKDARYSKELIF
jgi:ribosomal protein L21E